MDEIHHFFLFLNEFQIVKQRKAEYKVGQSESDSKGSFLDILLRMHMEDGLLTEDEVRDEVTSIFIGVCTIVMTKHCVTYCM